MYADFYPLSFYFIGLIAGEANYDEFDIDRFIHFIQDEYTAELLLDNLPGVMEVRTKEGLVRHLTGFPVGGVLLSKNTGLEMGYALNNHLDFTIHVNDHDVRDTLTVVGFDITPRR